MKLEPELNVRIAVEYFRVGLLIAFFQSQQLFGEELLYVIIILVGQVKCGITGELIEISAIGHGLYESGGNVRRLRRRRRRRVGRGQEAARIGRRAA